MITNENLHSRWKKVSYFLKCILEEFNTKFLMLIMYVSIKWNKWNSSDSLFYFNDLFSIIQKSIKSFDILDNDLIDLSNIIFIDLGHKQANK